MKYSIIIPAYNEETRIESTVRDYADFYQNLSTACQTEIIIIINGSSDRTGDIARQLEDEIENVRSWETPEKMGKGGAVLKGFELATGEITAFSDADNATSPVELKKLLDTVESGMDCAIGSRWLHGSVQEIPQPFGRRVASRVFNLIVRLLFQLQFYDTQCGAKAFRTDIIKGMQENLHSTGWAFDVELLWRLLQQNRTIQEVPIVWRDNSQSRLRMHVDAPSMLFELIRLRLKG